MGLLSEHGVGKIGIVGVGARAVPYTSFEQHVGRSSSPWEGQRMREVEGLRVRGVSEVCFAVSYLVPFQLSATLHLFGKERRAGANAPEQRDIAARFSMPHPRTLAYPHPEPVVARAAEPEPEPVLSAETKARFEAFWNKALVSIGVAAGQQRVDGEAVEGKVDAEAAVEGSDVAVMETAQDEVETTREGSEARELGEVKAREEMKTWLDGRGVDLGPVNRVEERGEKREGVRMAGAVKSVIATWEGMAEKRGEEGERVERAEGAMGAMGAGMVKSAIASGEAMVEKRSEGDEILERAEDVGKAMNAGVVKSVIASGEVMAEKRSEEEEEEEEEMPGLQVQKRRASEAEEAVRKALDEWRQGLERRTADVVVAAAPPLAKRTLNMDAENGGLEVRGQMGRLRGESLLHSQ